MNVHGLDDHLDWTDDEDDPLDRIRDAIEKLTALRDENYGLPWVRYEDGILVGIERLSAPDVYRTVVQAGEIRVSDAEMVLTVLRTLDAQLAILKHAAARAQSKIATGGIDRAVWSHEKDALALADAILAGDDR